MKRNAKSSSVMLAVWLSACLLAGCKGDTDTANVMSTESTVEIPEISQEQVDTGGITEEAETVATLECPEGYVYDYQVSMEPIPEEIAALGGPCQGTIHAFPSKIGMALTELEMEKDPILKAEVEKRIPEVEAALEEEIGGKFVVDGVILEDELSWTFFCTEVETGYQFDLYYLNNDYYNQIYNYDISLDNIIAVEDYFDEKESCIIRKEIIPLLEKYYIDGTFRVCCQSGANTIDIDIAQYADENVDKTEEQIKVLNIWEALQNYNSDIDYNISLTFYPLEYKDVMVEKYSTQYSYDLSPVILEENIQFWEENNEIWSSLIYSELLVRYEGEGETLDGLLQKYQEGKYDRDYIWKYWVR